MIQNWLLLIKSDEKKNSLKCILILICYSFSMFYTISCRFHHNFQVERWHNFLICISSCKIRCWHKVCFVSIRFAYECVCISVHRRITSNVLFSSTSSNLVAKSKNNNNKSKQHFEKINKWKKKSWTSSATSPVRKKLNK